MLLFVLLACGSADAPAPGPAPAAAPAEPPTVVVYSGRSESLMGPLFAEAEEALGVTIRAEYGDTAQMVTRVATEAGESPADVVLAQEVGHLDLLAKRGLLAPLPAGVTAPVDPRFRADDGVWVGTSGRLRVAVVDGEAVPAAERPASLKDLTDPKWKGRLGWAPANGSMQSHVGALCHLWGEDDTRAWIAGMVANAPRRYPKNSPQVDAADRGEIAIGWVNHYYLHRGERTRAVNHSFTAAGDAGNVLMIAGAAIRKDAPHADAAEKLVAYLVSKPAQAYFAREVFEYPVVPGVPTHPDVRPMADVALADVDPTALTDLGCARRLLDEADLL